MSSALDAPLSHFCHACAGPVAAVHDGDSVTCRACGGEWLEEIEGGAIHPHRAPPEAVAPAAAPLRAQFHVARNPRFDMAGRALPAATAEPLGVPGGSAAAAALVPPPPPPPSAAAPRGPRLRVGGGFGADHDDHDNGDDEEDDDDDDDDDYRGGGGYSGNFFGAATEVGAAHPHPSSAAAPTLQERQFVAALRLALGSMMQEHAEAEGGGGGAAVPINGGRSTAAVDARGALELLSGLLAGRVGAAGNPHRVAGGSAGGSGRYSSHASAGGGGGVGGRGFSTVGDYAWGDISVLAARLEAMDTASGNVRLALRPACPRAIAALPRLSRAQLEALPRSGAGEVVECPICQETLTLDTAAPPAGPTSGDASGSADHVSQAEGGGAVEGASVHADGSSEQLQRPSASPSDVGAAAAAAEDGAVVSLPCAHAYHLACALPWWRQQNTCPMCRFELPVEEDGDEWVAGGAVEADPSDGAVAAEAAGDA